ncbi:MAG: sigma-70 family RNA polymerase sigma factor [Sedimentisphaerales bacterium]|nr:sigma-70 family RNA polymerase sigma factor [Sedimentisphaerales bacterium]MBN2843646.1 sigma-70 family RNA polymerase sigma factor [Sedimentisphaerales bacterium]
MPSTIEKTTELLKKSDQELAFEAAGGSRGSYDELVNRYSQRIFKFVYVKTKNIECTEDIVQDTFIRAWLNLEKYDPKYCFSTWLYTIAIRLTQNHYRKKKAFTVEDEILDSHHRSVSWPIDDMIRKEQSDILWQKAARLKPEHYNMLWLKYVEQQTIEEIALTTGKSQVSVKVILHRARNKLATML